MIEKWLFISVKYVMPLKKIKAACDHGSGILSGVIEIDQIYVGGNERDKHNKDKPGARSGTVDTTSCVRYAWKGGRVKAMPIANIRKKKTLQGTIHQNIEKGSSLYTDEHRRYKGLDKAHYKHESVDHSAGEYVSGDCHSQGIESAWALLKRSILGVYHHVSKTPLGRYIDEVTFRFNEGCADRPVMKQVAALCHRHIGVHLTYKALTKG